MVAEHQCKSYICTGYGDHTVCALQHSIGLVSLVGKRVESECSNLTQLSLQRWRPQHSLQRLRSAHTKALIVAAHGVFFLVFVCHLYAGSSIPEDPWAEHSGLPLPILTWDMNYHEVNLFLEGWAGILGLSRLTFSVAFAWLSWLSCSEWLSISLALSCTKQAPFNTSLSTNDKFLQCKWKLSLQQVNLLIPKDLIVTIQIVVPFTLKSLVFYWNWKQVTMENFRRIHCPLKHC